MNHGPESALNPRSGTVRNSFNGSFILLGIALAGMSLFNLVRKWFQIDLSLSVDTLTGHYELIFTIPLQKLLGWISIDISLIFSDVMIMYILVGGFFQRAIWPLYISARGLASPSEGLVRTFGLVQTSLFGMGWLSDWTHRAAYMCLWPVATLVTLRYPYLNYEREADYRHPDFERITIWDQRLKDEASDPFKRSGLVGWTVYNVPVAILIQTLSAITVTILLIATNQILFFVGR